MSDEPLDQDQFYILATSARTDDRTRVMKQGNTFAVFDRFGDIEPVGNGELGIYEHDTRILSRLSLRLEGRRPLLLSSTIKDSNAVLAVDLMNPDLPRHDHLIPRGTVHIDRSRVLLDGACHERIRIHNYGRTSVELAMSIECGADFADIFEVRGTRRARRGKHLSTRVEGAALELGYEGLDGRIRCTRLAFDPQPTRLSEGRAEYTLQLPPRGEVVCQLMVTSGGADGVRAPEKLSYEDAARKASDILARARADEPQISTSSEPFNNWLSRSLADLHMMRTETVHGPYPYAGVPWFSTPFGRDGIITALECLWFDPNVAKGVLQYLAATQADSDRADADAQPGKVLHETRSGEMAATGEVPFGRYYGSVDATPLFVMLAGSYYERTGDLGLAENLGRTSSGHSIGSIATGISIPTVSSSRHAAPRTGSFNRVGKIRTTRSFTATARSPKRRSRCARCKPTSTRRSAPRRSSRARSSNRLAHASSTTRRAPCSSASRRRFGAMTCRPMGWRSTGASSCAGYAHRTPGTASTRVSPATSAQSESLRRS
jgi:glycogen debranching enzyme